ncbi:MAG: PHP domain-containing protein, partial [Pirellulaceae bacterium]
MNYAELHCKSSFSFLQGASSADQLVQRAVRLGYTALAITDRNTLAGIVRGHGAAVDAELQYIVAAELTFDDAPPCVVWIRNRSAYAALCRLLTLGRRQASKGNCRLSFEDLVSHGDEFLLGVIPDWNRLSTGASSDHHRMHAAAELIDAADLQRYDDIFGERCYLLAELHRGSADLQRLDLLQKLSQQTRVPLVASGDVYYHDPSHARLQDVLTATAHGCTVHDIGPYQFANAQRHMRP